MEANGIFEQITAYIDNEITNRDEKKKLELLIENDSQVRQEYLFQSGIKNHIKNRVHFVETPQHLRNRILNQIDGQMVRESKKLIWYKKLFQPKFAFALTIILLFLLAAGAAGYFFLIKGNSGGSPASGHGEIHNMLVQARQNFQKITEGQMPLQLTSNSASIIKKFFKDNGVSFNPIVPEFKEWTLQGARVSDNRGEKFPHNVYKGKDGKLVYLYQADGNCLKRKILTLSDDVIKSMDEGKYYKVVSGDESMLVWKCRGNICIVVSNDHMDKLENTFLTLQDK